MAKSLTLSATVSSFLFNAPSTTETYTLSLHDALPILIDPINTGSAPWLATKDPIFANASVHNDVAHSYRPEDEDRKSTRLNSSHSSISYAVFCLKKKTTCESPDQQSELDDDVRI